MRDNFGRERTRQITVHPPTHGAMLFALHIGLEGVFAVSLASNLMGWTIRVFTDVMTGRCDFSAWEYWMGG